MLSKTFSQGPRMPMGLVGHVRTGRVHASEVSQGAAAGGEWIRKYQKYAVPDANFGLSRP